jgi:hypothetical protein
VELKAMVDQGFDSVFGVLNGRADAAYLDLRTFKQRLTGPAGTQAAMTLLRAQPPCSLEQIAVMTLAAISLQGDIELCNPSDELAPVIQPLIEINLQAAALAIPDRAPLFTRTIDLTGSTTPLEGLRIIRLAMRLSPLIPLVFLLGVTLFGVRSLNSWLKWWGWPFLVTGFFGLLVGLLSAPVLNILLTNLLSSRLPAFLPINFSIWSGAGGCIVHSCSRLYGKA